MSVPITNIQLLVHPYYHSIYSDPMMDSHKFLEEIREQWWRRALLVQQHPNSVLVEFTSMDLPDYEQYRERYDDTSKILIEKFDRELLRIWQYKDMLEDRYILLPGDKQAGKIDWEKEFKCRGLTIDERVFIQAFGEYSYNCVEDWGHGTVNKLRQLGYKAKIEFLEEISLNESLVDEVTRDREIFGEYVGGSLMSR